VAIFVVSMSSITIIGTEFVPPEDRGEFQVIVDLPPGVSFDESVREIAKVEREVLATPEVRQVFSTVGVQGEIRKSTLRVQTSRKDERKRGLIEIKADLRRRLAAMPFIEAKVADPEFMQGAPYEPPINLYIRGDDLAELQRISDDIVARIRKVPGAVDISSSLVAGKPEMVARVDRPRAADLGFSVGAVAAQLRGMVEGVVPSRLRDGDRQYDIRVRLAPEYRNDFGAIARAPIYSPSGAAVRAGDVVSLAPGLGPTTIDREQRRRQAKVGADLYNRPLGDVTNDISAAIADIKLPPRVEVGFAGDVELMQESAQGLVLALLLAVVFIYIVLASQFESFLEPFIIMLSLPLALVGALLLLLVTGKHLGMPAMIGVVMLMGLVTKNAILLVDYTNQLRAEGMPLEQAILKAGPVRLRPILMTTLAMILGMLPAVFGVGEGGEFRAPMAISTVGGLITSTLLTLVLVPVAYMLLARGIAWARSAMRRPSPAVAKALRVTGVLVLLAIIGGVSAFAF
jgi:multidrug efflux pump subunit AcrB